MARDWTGHSRWNNSLRFFGRRAPYSLWQPHTLEDERIRSRRHCRAWLYPGDTILLSKDVALAEGLVAFIVLIGLQYIVTSLSVRSKTINDLVKSEPVLLLYRGELLYEQLKKARVVDTEVITAIRQQGIGTISKVEAVVLETMGSFAVVGQTATPTTSLDGIPMPTNVAQQTASASDDQSAEEGSLALTICAYEEIVSLYMSFLQ